MTGIYIHIPFCKARCGYCAFCSAVSDESDMRRYLDALLSEIDARTDPRERITADTVYIGGGTPSVLPDGCLTKILNKIRDRFFLMPDAEITVESNPESCTESFVREIKSAGANRVSLGLQSHEDAILRQIGRVHSASDFIRAVGTLKNEGIFNLSADIMFGLPGQSQESVLRSVDFVLAASRSIRHISVYALSVEEGTPLYKSGFRQDEDLQADMYAAVCERLEDKGLFRYEISNFAATGSESRHNRKYWSGKPYFGFGLSAHSFIGADRIENTDVMAAYLKGNFESGRRCIAPKERAEEILMLSLRTKMGLNLTEYKKVAGVDLAAEKSTVIKRLQNLGLLSLHNDTLCVTNKGFFVLNSILTELL